MINSNIRYRLVHRCFLIFFVTFLPLSAVNADRGRRSPIDDFDIYSARQYLCLVKNLDQGVNFLRHNLDGDLINDVIEMALEDCGVTTKDPLAEYFFDYVDPFTFDFSDNSESSNSTLITSFAGQATEQIGGVCEIENCEDIDEIRQLGSDLRNRAEKVTSDIRDLNRELITLKQEYRSLLQSISSKLREVNIAWNRYWGNYPAGSPNSSFKAGYVEAVRALAQERRRIMSKRDAVLQKEMALVEKNLELRKLGVDFQLAKQIFVLCGGSN